MDDSSPTRRSAAARPSQARPDGGSAPTDADRAAAEGRGAGTLAYHWIRIPIRDGAPPLAAPGPGGTLKPTARGRRVAACWRALGEGRPHLRPDALALRPDGVEGLIALALPAGSAALAEAIRLFKAATARALAAEPAALEAREGRREGTAKGIRPARAGTDRSPARGKGPAAGPWKRGYAERPLEDAAAVSAARAALDGTIA